MLLLCKNQFCTYTQASKTSQSEAQKEKDRKRKEYRQKILQQHGQSTSSAPGKEPPNKKMKRAAAAAASSSKQPSLPTSSAFQEAFAQRAQGFQIDFRFRNAPPRPPVGPCFVGDTLSKVLLQQSRTYKPFNAVEAQHVWKLHNEADLGVPLAPSAMDLAAYSNEGLSPEDENNNKNRNDNRSKLHPDDLALLDWQGSMGDTAADQRQARQVAARAAARQWLQSGDDKQQFSKQQQKKAFSRVLKEDMQTWMKKTTYLSNDYSRKVHDFKSLAQTKQELAADLQAKQEEMAQRRTLRTIEASFDVFGDNASTTLQHPTKKNLKPKSVLPVLPHVSNWGRAFTHVVIDKPPLISDPSYKMTDLHKGAWVANVEKRGQNARMSCQIVAPYKNDEDIKEAVIPIQTFDLDVVPLKEEDAPHSNFCVWVDEERGLAMYLPISSRIQLSTGRPVRSGAYQALERRPMTLTEQREMEERMAEIDREMAEKHLVSNEPTIAAAATTTTTSKVSSNEEKTTNNNGENDDGEGDFGDDDSSSEDD